jgi:hypothetical protein
LRRAEKQERGQLHVIYYGLGHETNALTDAVMSMFFMSDVPSTSHAWAPRRCQWRFV